MTWTTCTASRSGCCTDPRDNPPHRPGRAPRSPAASGLRGVRAAQLRAHVRPYQFGLDLVPAQLAGLDVLGEVAGHLVPGREFAQLGPVGGAPLLRPRAARVEPAAGRWPRW